MDFGISTDEFGIMTEAQPVLQETYKALSLESILSIFRSGVGLDIAKNHTGVSMWKDGVLTTLGFNIDMDYDKTDYMAEAKMRIQFKRLITDILKDYNWEVCVIEDVYGGSNFDTTRKLLALNCVVDELALEGVINVEHIYRLKEAEWLKSLRTISNKGTRLNPKYECQAILEFLKFPFYLENVSKSETEKRKLFFEDRCDATGQLLALALKLTDADVKTKSSSVRMSNLYVNFFEDEDDVYWSDDKVLKNAEVVFVDFPEAGDIEEILLQLVNENKESVLMMKVPTDKLGTFGVVNGFEFFEQGYGFLVCYDKGLRKSFK